MNPKIFSLKFIKSVRLVWCIMFETLGTIRKLPKHRIFNYILYEITHSLYLASDLKKKKKKKLSTNLNRRFFPKKPNRKLRRLTGRRHCVRVSHVSCVLSVQPHGLQPARLLRLRNSPGKHTGVSCHALLQGIFST